MKTVIGLLGAISVVCLTDAYIIPSEQTQIVCPCQYRYDPVCGSDGVTYMNECVLNCTSQANTGQDAPAITSVRESECSGNCRCQNVDLPVCTLDGLIYPNECVLACENIQRIANRQPIIYLAYRTVCRGLPGNCTDIAAPVCGTDNVLYRNKCVLDYVNIYNLQVGLPPLTVKNNGACQDGYLCPITKQPVCASDGNFYYNRCELEAENARRRCNHAAIFLYEVDQSVCNECRCPKLHDPVCASDGNTYSNLCQLECAIRKQSNPHLRSVYKGKCRACDCKEEHLPVCGTDRKTYDNRCLLECENIGRSEDLPALNIFHKGKCQQFACDCSYCDENYQAMCGSDGQTYWNLCWLQCNDRCYKNNGKDAVFLSRRGPC